MEPENEQGEQAKFWLIVLTIVLMLLPGVLWAGRHWFGWF